MKATLEEKTILERKTVWEGLTEYQFQDAEDLFNISDGGIGGTAELLKKMKVNQYYVVKTIPSETKNTNRFNKTLEELKYYGLDIGKGDCEYGYKMPLPKNGEEDRKLIIFKRR